MSNSPHRSFARITRTDLARLAEIALDDFADLCEQQKYSRRYAGRLRLILFVPRPPLVITSIMIVAFRTSTYGSLKTTRRSYKSVDYEIT